MLPQSRATPESRTRLYFVEGQPVELWENPNVAFGWSGEDLSAYAAGGRWDLVFNGLVLSAVLEGQL